MTRFGRRLWLGGAALVALAVAVAVGVLLYRPGAAPEYRIETVEIAIDDPAFTRSAGGVLGAPPVDGNDVHILENGVGIFPPMLDAIRGAEHTVNFETFIFTAGAVADEFTEALAERAAAGVEVNVLMDAMGASEMDASLVRRMREAGATVHVFNDPTLDDPASIAGVSFRTHRKLLIVDGRIGFLGGVGIADQWQGDARGPDEWRELHFRVEGPVVASLQAAFCENWRTISSELLLGDGHYPALESRGAMTAIAVCASPRGDSGSIQTMFLLAIAGARRSIRIATPYFVPDELTLRQLVDARERGVAVEIILPGPHTDSPAVADASRRLWGGLLEAGVRIHEYQPTMFHSKYMLVDDHWSAIGSANFDNRSFKLNDEANLVVADRAFGAAMERVFEADLARCRAVRLDEWNDRPWHERARESWVAFLREHM